MNTKLLMTVSALLMGATGILLIFIPQEISTYLELTGSGTILLQLFGALYFGFAMINWTGKANLIGGIYSRPLAIGNFTHFFIGAFALIKLASANSSLTWIWIATIIYSLFAVLFGYIFFTAPAIKK
jgi:hypothetical protein